MSEQILKALMQLFAIIARPESSKSDRRTVVESFLKRQLNVDLVIEYIKIFDYFYNINQEKSKETEKQHRRISASSVKVLKICSAINEELTQEQKVVVLIQLFEFVLSDDDQISEQEMAFIDTVADSFHITASEYAELKDFVQYSADQLPDTKSVLVIDNNKDFFHPSVKHIYCEPLTGQVRVLQVASSNMYFVKYMGKNEVYLNGQILQHEKIFVLNYGSSIRNQLIRPIYYSDIISQFNDDKLKSKILFEVKNVEYQFKNGKLGLHDIKLHEESGHLVGIMGASGAGKSTLLHVLNGNNTPSKGSVEINGINIHTQKEEIKGIIGFVSQDDLLIEELSVYQNLYYNAKLCFDNYTEEKLVETVNTTLMNLGLYEIRDIQVGNPLNKKISGGQRKRLNIALELIREPSVLFLDEPTSGLSSRDSENILDLLKELTLKGKLVFVVIHQPSSDIFKMFDRLIILDTGGYLIYNGDPIDSIIYFKSRIHHANWSESECHECGNVNPEQVFNIVETRVLNEYGQETHARKISPKEWSNFYEESVTGNYDKSVNQSDLPTIHFKTPNLLSQLQIFIKRDVLSKLSNTQYLIINLLEAPLLAFILAYIIRFYNVSITNQFGYTLNDNSNLPVYIFMSVIVAIFMGLTVSAEEIIKDRKILKREAFLNLSWFSYLVSKVSVLFIISAIQAFLFVIVGNSIIEIKGMYFEYWLVLFSVWVSANMLGLVISDSFKTVVTIYILIPFLVIPQILLSGVIVKFEKINPKISSPSSIPFYGELITARWGYEALSVYQFLENDYQKQFNIYDKAMSIAEYKKNYWLLNLKTKSEYIGRYLNDKTKSKEIAQYLKVLQYELSEETKKIKKIPFKYTSFLTTEKISIEVVENTDIYLEQLQKYYIKLYNTANSKKDNLISQMQATPTERDKFMNLKRKYSNESLTEFVTNASELERVLEYKNSLIQKIDPIFLDSKSKFIKAHFYAPRKMIFGVYLHTFWVNVIVIWLMTIGLFIILYYRLLKRLLDYLESMGEK